MAYHLPQAVDFETHNAAVAQLWQDYGKRCQARVPVSINGSIRNLLSNPELNRTGYTFKDFFVKAEAQVACQLEYQHYVRHHVVCDREMGLPKNGWNLSLDFQNSHDQAWFGCPFLFFGDTAVPDTVEVLKDDPEALYKWGEPDAFWGRGDFMKHAMDMYQGIKAKCDGGLEFHGRPVLPPTRFPCGGTDGLFTVALKLRGTVETMTDMYENPKYFHDLMDYITRTSIARIKAHREWAWDHDPNYKGDRKHRGGFSHADDSIAMLSPDQFKEFVLPYMQRLFDEFHDGSGSHFHLCGDATHHFPFLAKQFNVKSFDTGFPVNHGKLRQVLGPDIQINGGPTIMLLQAGKPDAIRAETKRICQSGVMEGRRFLLIAANNLAPCTPVENILALYEAGKEFGKY